MFSKLTLSTLAVLASLLPAHGVPTPDTLAERNNGGSGSAKGPYDGWDQNQDPTEIIKELYDSVTVNGANAIMPSDGYIYRYLDAPFFGGGGEDGGVVLADNQVWPGVVKNDLSGLVGFIGPCGMVAPHNHPRAAETLINVAGPPLLAGSFNENGSPYYSGQLNVGDIVMLPRGSIHFVANSGCEPAFIVSAFNADSPGVGFLYSAFSSIDEDTISAAFGGADLPGFDPAKIATTVQIGRDECLAKCGIDRSTYDISHVTSKELMQGAMAGWLKSTGYDWSAEPWKHWAA